MPPAGTLYSSTCMKGMPCIIMPFLTSDYARGFSRERERESAPAAPRSSNRRRLSPARVPNFDCALRWRTHHRRTPQPAPLFCYYATRAAHSHCARRREESGRTTLSLPLCPAPRRCWLGHKEEREMRGLLAQGLAVNRDDALKTRIFKHILPQFIHSAGQKIAWTRL
jgi:hypothetical protein